MTIGTTPNRFPLHVLFAMAALTLYTMSGCGNSSTAPTASNTDTSPGQTAVGNTPAAASSEDPAAGAKQTVAVFLDCLRRGDEATANSMLTTKAREEMQKTAWVMQPLGTPEGKYTIGRAGFPYQDKSAVLVECRWQEPSEPGAPEVAMDIVCELYEEAEGWRIAGLAINLPGEEDALVIDFEDSKRLQEMLDLANGGNNAPAGGPLSPAGESPSPLNNTQLPALPDFPGAGGSQIASPPGAGGVLR